MNGRCYKCNNPLTTGDFDGMCNDCKKQQNDTEISIVEQALTELEELKSWRDELNGTIQDLISKAKHWEEKENKTDFEKGIARGYKTMLHQLLVGIDFDKEIENE